MANSLPGAQSRLIASTAATRDRNVDPGGRFDQPAYAGANDAEADAKPAAEADTGPEATARTRPGSTPGRDATARTEEFDKDETQPGTGT